MIQYLNRRRFQNRYFFAHGQSLKTGEKFGFSLFPYKGIGSSVFYQPDQIHGKQLLNDIQSHFYRELWVLDQMKPNSIIIPLIVMYFD
jgi:hypothetical protein